MANMTFKTNLLPNSTTLEYSLGSENQPWKINGYNIEDTYVQKAGDTMTGVLSGPTFWANQGSEERQLGVTYSNGNLYFFANPSTGTAGIYDSNGSYIMQRDTSTNKYNIWGQKVYGAVWNDYAEYRKDNPKEKQEPGKCVHEVGDGTLSLTAKRLERGCEIISDTFGFAIGEDKENGYNTPIASNGRVLAYPYESIEKFSKHIGWPVCSGPNGTVSIMTEEEEEKYPSRIIGTISEIPSYEEWGTGKVKVNGRVWIRI